MNYLCHNNFLIPLIEAQKLINKLIGRGPPAPGTNNTSPDLNVVSGTDIRPNPQDGILHLIRVVVCRLAGMHHTNDASAPQDTSTSMIAALSPLTTMRSGLTRRPLDRVNVLSCRTSILLSRAFRASLDTMLLCLDRRISSVTGQLCKM